MRLSLRHNGRYNSYVAKSIFNCKQGAASGCTNKQWVVK